MGKIPFAPYDFFGYLASGLIFAAGCQEALGYPRVLGQQLNVVDSLFLLLVVYILGHVMATPAKALLEDFVVGRVLGRPSENLFRNTKPRIKSLLLPGYFKPLPPDARHRILRRVKDEGIHTTGEELFQHVRFSASIRGNEQVLARLDSFRNQYGFSRNLCFVLLVVGAIMLVQNSFTPRSQMQTYGWLCVVVSVLLFYRFLKFYRQYAYEMFNHYRPELQGRIV